MIKLFVGLGNPGVEYEATRHNAGFWWVDAVAKALKTSLAFDKSYFGNVARVALTAGDAARLGEAAKQTGLAKGFDAQALAGQTVWLLQPQTFMNGSGKSVAALARFFKIAPEEVLVAHDELDIVPGQAKLRLGGSHAGHNGLRDIHAQLGTDAYWRLRIGIGHPGVKSEVIHWVLKKPAPEQRDLMEQTVERSERALPFFLAGDMEKATLVVHTAKPPRPKPPKPEPLSAPDSI